MPYDLLPGVDPAYNFPPPVRQAIADAAELTGKFAAKSLEAQVAAWTPSGTFRGTWSNAIAYAQGSQVVHAEVLYAANALTVAGDTPGVSSKWTVIPSVESPTSRIANITRIAAATPGAWYTNLALTPVPYPAPFVTTGWGHSGNSAGTNSRNSGVGPYPEAPAFYRRTFSDIPNAPQGIYYMVTGLTEGKQYSFRMSGRTSWNSRRCLQISFRNASGVEVGLIQSPWSELVIAEPGQGTWTSIGFKSPILSPPGTVEASVRMMAEVGGLSQSITLVGNTVDGSAAMAVEGSTPPPWFTGNSTLGWWLGVKDSSKSYGFVPQTQAQARPKLIEIAADGGDYQTIQAGVDAASDGDTLQIYPGEYRESISGWGRRDLHYKGVSRDKCVIIDSTGAYSTPALEIGSGSVRSLTIISDHAMAGTDVDAFEDQRGYSIHPDNHGSMVGGTLTIEDCTLKNSRRTAIGCGLYQDTKVIVRGCDIWAGKPTLSGDRNRGAIYFHNRSTTQEVTTNQSIVLENNTIFCDDDKVFYLYDAGLGVELQSVMEVLCLRNTFWSKTQGAGDHILGGTGFWTADVTRHPASTGNNIPKLNAY